MRKTYNLFILYVFVGLWYSCAKIKQVSFPALNQEKYAIHSEFELTSVAAEPLLEAPVALDFDHKGRMWVVEMIGFMQDIKGSGEGEPSGSIVILEDQDGNGKMDHRKVFLDQLVMPRALLLFEEGLLYAVPPNLWFVEIENDLPGKKVLIDSLYAEGGNVEHQANGLVLNLDNWIYNAKSNIRYKRINGEWVKEFTAYRGQFGLTKDDEGRLYYNNNSNQFKGDYFLPNAPLKNSFLKPKNSVDIQIVEDQSVYPLHATAINRGYGKNQLDEKGFVKNFTSACGLVVYRGGNWGQKYNQNGFACGPEVNLIKRNHLMFGELETIGSQVEKGHEFIASTDEGFRPVNMYNGPDGNLYVTDMHRGIIQHKSYMTEYLRSETIERQLDTIIKMGRILKITKKDAKDISFVDISTKSNAELISLLNHENGWVRDHAQQELIRKELVAIDIYELEKSTTAKAISNYSGVHALWTLEGTNNLKESLLKKIIGNANDVVQAHALFILGDQFNDSKEDFWLNDLSTAIETNRPKIDPYLAFTTGRLRNLDQEKRFDLITKIMVRYPRRSQVAEMAVSGLGDEETLFWAYTTKMYPKETKIAEGWAKVFNQVIDNRANDERNNDLVAPLVYTDGRTQAMLDYRQYCGTCHGLDGEGRDNLAPPLTGSEYVSGDPDKLMLITLYGISGPIVVAGKKYDINAEMPGLANNSELSDEEIAGILNFIRNGFATAKTNCSAERISALREVKPPEGTWDVESLEAAVKLLQN